MNAEDPVARLFDLVVQDLHPAVDALVEQSERQGRRLRTRRRVRLAVGNALAVAAVVGAGVAVSMHVSKPGVTGPVGLTGTGTASATASPSPSPTSTLRASASPSTSPVRTAGPSASPSPTGKAGATAAVTAQQLLATLRTLVPAGGTFSDVRTTLGPGSIEVDYDDGHGAVDLLLSVDADGSKYLPLDCPSPLWTDEGTRPQGALPISCTLRTLADGSTERDAVMYADSEGFYGFNIYDLRPDGSLVYLQVGNGINHGIPQVDRAVPPGSMAQWTAIVENAVWHP